MDEYFINSINNPKAYESQLCQNYNIYSDKKLRDAKCEQIFEYMGYGAYSGKKNFSEGRYFINL